MPRKRRLDQCIGRSKGGLSRKIPPRGDALGNPTGFELTAGQAHDVEGAHVLLDDIDVGSLLVDQDSDAEPRVLACLKGTNCQIVIRSKTNCQLQRKSGQQLDKARQQN